VKIDGNCHCGKISYVAEIDPKNIAICHCTDCQVLSGTAFRTIGYVSSENIEFSGRIPKIYLKTGESGNIRQQAFCSDCGTQLYATAAGDDPKIYGIRLGTARQRDLLSPRKQHWCRSALEWVGDLRDIPREEKQ